MERIQAVPELWSGGQGGIQDKMWTEKGQIDEVHMVGLGTANDDTC